MMSRSPRFLASACCGKLRLPFDPVLSARSSGLIPWSRCSQHNSVLVEFSSSHLFSSSAFRSNGTEQRARRFSTSFTRLIGEFERLDPKSEDEVVNIVYIAKNGARVPIRGKVGDNALFLAHRHEIEMEGACEGSLACTTCHVYVNHPFLEKLPEALEEEEDLLDMAPFLKENSRLGCQIKLTKKLEGMELTLPVATKNFYVDGHVPAPH